MKAPTQPLPWSVQEDRAPGYPSDFRILDANGCWVASFGPVRAEAEFVVECVNKTEKRKRARR